MVGLDGIGDQLDLLMCPVREAARCRLVASATCQAARSCPLWSSGGTVLFGLDGALIRYSAPRRHSRGAYNGRLDLRAFRQRQRVLDVHPEVADCALDLGVTEEDLYSAQIARRLRRRPKASLEKCVKVSAAIGRDEQLQAMVAQCHLRRPARDMPERASEIGLTKGACSDAAETAPSGSDILTLFFSCSPRLGRG